MDNIIIDLRECRNKLKGMLCTVHDSYLHGTLTVSCDALKRAIEHAERSMIINNIGDDDNANES